jgi:N-methylhydantoinase A
MADFRHDFVQTYLQPMSLIELNSFNQAWKEIEAKAVRQMIKENVPEKDICLKRTADMRYTGQGYTLEVNVPDGELSPSDMAMIADRLHAAHIESYGYDMRDHHVEFVNLRITAIGMLSKPQFKKEPLHDKRPPKNAQKGQRQVFSDGGGFVETAIYERSRLSPGNEINGPAIIEQLDSTTVVLPGYEVLVDAYKNLIIMKKGHSDGKTR